MTDLRSDRRGFALPMVVLVMFVLVGAVTAGFNILSGERAADDATLQSEASVALAEAGIQHALRNRAAVGLSPVPVAGTESVRVTLSGGYVDVIQSQIRPQIDDAQTGVYFIRARGVRTRSGVANSGNAMSYASLFATYKRVSMTVQSAMTGINGIKKAGSSGLISGFDVCGQKANLPAVAVPEDPGITGSGQWETSLEGTSKWTEIGATQEEAADAVPIDWDAIVNDGAVPADFYVPDVAFPNSTWFSDNPDSWPTIIVKNGPNPMTEWSLPNWGRGLLIVYGDLNLNGNSAGWDGLVLVGGRLKSNGANEVAGAVITGLNVKLGYTVEDNDVNELQGTKKYLYNSCKVSSALNGGAGSSMRAWNNTWANTFRTF
jgi:hypothetical protein